ncbi:hypothetical protein CFE70_002238 [Pyrenophora teres f. teres 0-1]
MDKTAKPHCNPMRWLRRQRSVSDVSSPPQHTRSPTLRRLRAIVQPSHQRHQRHQRHVKTDPHHEALKRIPRICLRLVKGRSSETQLPFSHLGLALRMCNDAAVSQDVRRPFGAHEYSLMSPETAKGSWPCQGHRAVEQRLSNIVGMKMVVLCPPNAGLGLMDERGASGSYWLTRTGAAAPFFLALRSFSSPSPLPFDFTSSITASQQSSWLSSPAPHASRQPQNTSQTTFAHRQADFVLYDQPAQVSQRPLRAPSAPQPGHTFNNGHHFYANSAPSSTTEFQQPRLLQRPPVPLFSSSSNNIPQLHNVTNMAGTMRAFRYPNRELTFPADLNSNNSFDSGASLMSNFNNGGFSMDHVSAFTAINDPSVAAGSTRTVSPRTSSMMALGLRHHLRRLQT